MDAHAYFTGQIRQKERVSYPKLHAHLFHIKITKNYKRCLFHSKINIFIMEILIILHGKKVYFWEHFVLSFYDVTFCYTKVKKYFNPLMLL